MNLYSGARTGTRTMFTSAPAGRAEDSAPFPRFPGNLTAPLPPAGERSEVRGVDGQNQVQFPAFFR